MALHVPRAPGMAQMLKEGSRYFSGLEEAVFRNISACKEFTQSLRPTYGPNGMNKMVINHIEKQFVTSDAATLMRELEVEHPAVKLIVLASQMQDEEVGDGTNFVVIFAGALLEAAEELLRLGVTPGEIAEGYERALDKSLEILPTLTCYEMKDTRNFAEVTKAIKTSVMSKQYGNEDFICDLIVKACVSILPEHTTFNVDNVRLCKILGSGLLSSEVLQGMVFKKHIEGDVTNVKNAKIALYSCAVDVMQTETKGTVLIKSAKELMNFSRGEETLLESQIKAIADTGAKVIVGGAKFGDMAMHYINKYEMMAVHLNSKFDLRRLSKTVGGTVLPKLIPPTSEELGYCDVVCVDEVGDTSIVVFKLEGKESRIATIVIRGSTDNYMDDIERAVDDGVNTFKCMSRDGRFLPGAGATEMALSKQLTTYAGTLPGLEQYAVRKFAVALETFPKTLAENSGLKASIVLNKLIAAHQSNHTASVDIESESNDICDAKAKNILDLYVCKKWGIQYAVGAACTILRIDQIIMAKRAGGPKPRGPAGDQDED